MKMKNIVLAAALFIVVAIACGCGRNEAYGEKISNRAITPVKDILLRPDSYAGKTVTIKGKIAIECETGCWFNFKDGDAVIYVNLEPSGFAIPQKGGKDASVEGSVTIKNGKPTFIGKGVEIR